MPSVPSLAAYAGPIFALAVLGATRIARFLIAFRSGPVVVTSANKYASRLTRAYDAIAQRPKLCEIKEKTQPASIRQQGNNSRALYLIASRSVPDTQMFLTRFVMLNGGIAERKIISRRLYRTAIKNASLNRVPKLFCRSEELFALRASFTPTLGDGTGESSRGRESG